MDASKFFSKLSRVLEACAHARDEQTRGDDEESYTDAVDALVETMVTLAGEAGIPDAVAYVEAYTAVKFGIGDAGDLFDPDADAPDDPMDGDHASALASAGLGTDEDYGGGNEDPGE